jgi:signal transduction histidine kinase
MSLGSSIVSALKLEPRAHRPPLSRRFWFYSLSAFLMPIVVQLALPEDPGLTDELIWLVTLVPAFLLSLHYGVWGAFLALIMGTGLFIVVQLVLAFKFTPDDWRITVPAYVAFGTLAISVGWLSEQLHGYYKRVLDSERMVAVGQLAVAVQHELNNALTVVVAESQLLRVEQANLTSEQRESITAIYEAASRMSEHVKKLGKLAEAPVVTYDGDIKMIDVKGAKEKE